MTAPPVQSFFADKVREEVVASILDAFYQERGVVMSVHHVRTEFQRLAGIDRVMTLRSGTRNTYEDKADFRAADTGNLFIETWSKRGDVRGWGYTCGAQYLDVFIAQHRTLLFGETLRLKECVRAWDHSGRFPERKAVNQNYETVGLVVPIPVVVKEANLMALDVSEDVVRTGIARYCARHASREVNAVIDERVARAVGAGWEYCLAVIGAEPKGRIAGIAYRGADDVAAIMERLNQKQIVADYLERNGSVSEEWFSRVIGGVRLAPVVEQLRADGWSIANDAETRSYRLVSAAEQTASELPLFGETA